MLSIESTKIFKEYIFLYYKIINIDIKKIQNNYN